MTETEERKLAFSKLESIKGSKIIQNNKACYFEIIKWAFEHLEEIVKLFPINQWEPEWSYYLLEDTKVPEKYWDQLYEGISESSLYSYWLLRDTEVPEKYKKLLENSVKKGGYDE